MKNVAAINQYLERLKSALELGNFAISSRKKNYDFLAKRRLDDDDVFEILGDLNHSHYHSGPLRDNDKSSAGSIMVFFYPLAPDTVYIKLKIWTDRESGENGVAISFHEEGQHND